MLTFPLINPVAISLGPLKIHWYGIMYLLAFLSAWVLARFRVKYYHLDWTVEQISDLIFYAALGVIIGGRLGYMLFYNTPELLSNPWSLFKLWQGGMSFHGGLLGVFVALIVYSYKINKHFLQITDFVVPLVPLGLAFGRAGNFINGELWGRKTSVPWAMIFPYSDGKMRHPSQLYELGLEGILLFILVWWFAAKPRPTGYLSAIFLIGYASFRIFVECFREPDVQFGFIVLNCLTMGQLLSIPMLLVGLYLWWIKR